MHPSQGFDYLVRDVPCQPSCEVLVRARPTDRRLVQSHPQPGSLRPVRMVVDRPQDVCAIKVPLWPSVHQGSRFKELLRVAHPRTQRPDHALAPVGSDNGGLPTDRNAVALFRLLVLQGRSIGVTHPLESAAPVPPQLRQLAFPVVVAATGGRLTASDALPLGPERLAHVEVLQDLSPDLGVATATQRESEAQEGRQGRLTDMHLQLLVPCGGGFRENLFD